MRTPARLVLLLATLAVPCTLIAQEPAPAPVVCRASACLLEFDWGGGQTAASIINDRRYGAGTDFENALKQRLNEKGFRIVDPGGTAGLKATLRLAMNNNALCDFMAGLNPDRSCKTLRDVNVTFTPNDTTIRKINSQRITNRCGDPNQLMTMTQFGQYAAEMLYYVIEGEKAKAPKPVAKC
jgi:hypothetical protein